MTYPHGPRDWETPEQVLYRKHTLPLSFDDGITGSQNEEGQIEASGVSGNKNRSLLSKFGDKIKTFANNIRPGIHFTKSLVSLEPQITRDIHDVNIFPEVAHTAQVRRGLQLCREELEYLETRKIHTRNHFARYMGWDPNAVHPDDVPIVGFGGSGGGYRAMLAFLGYSHAFKQTGLWDLLTYVAGVSGSCWTLGAMYTFAEGDTDKLIEHCRTRLSPHHPLSPDAVQILLRSYRGAYDTIGPLVHKHRSGLHTVPMDLYSVLTTGYLFMQDQPPADEAEMTNKEGTGNCQRRWYKWSDAQKALLNGAEPLPILTAIRHERPWKQWADPEHPFTEDEAAATLKGDGDAEDAWFQWFEFTPFEVGCDELEAWCPTYAFGRPFEEGKSTHQLPEQSLALLLGLCTSAPAGPLSSYLATIQRSLPTGIVGDTVEAVSSEIASRLWGKQGTAVFTNHHPLHASNEHNFLFHHSPVSRPGAPRPPGLENSPRIHLIDSGLDNNCPTMPLLSPERRVDVVINMDASSDVQRDSFLQRVQQIGSRRGLCFSRRPPPRRQPRADEGGGDAEQSGDPAGTFEGLYAQIYDGTRASRPDTVVDSYGNTVANPPAPVVHHDCTMIYLPLLPNERAVPGYDPSTADFSGSYNLVWTPEQVDMIIRVSVQNLLDGQDTIRQALFDAWQRKTRIRQLREGKEGTGMGKGL